MRRSNTWTSSRAWRSRDDACLEGRGHDRFWDLVVEIPERQGRVQTDGPDGHTCGHVDTTASTDSIPIPASANRSTPRPAAVRRPDLRSQDNLSRSTPASTASASRPPKRSRSSGATAPRSSTARRTRSRLAGCSDAQTSTRRVTSSAPRTTRASPPMSANSTPRVRSAARIVRGPNRAFVVTRFPPLGGARAGAAATARVRRAAAASAGDRRALVLLKHDGQVEAAHEPERGVGADIVDLNVEMSRTFAPNGRRRRQRQLDLKAPTVLQSILQRNALSSGGSTATLSGAFVEPSVGLEPTTPSLPWKCSTS